MAELTSISTCTRAAATKAKEPRNIPTVIFFSGLKQQKTWDLREVPIQNFRCLFFLSTLENSNGHSYHIITIWRADVITESVLLSCVPLSSQLHYEEIHLSCSILITCYPASAGLKNWLTTIIRFLKKIWFCRKKKPNPIQLLAVKQERDKKIYL